MYQFENQVNPNFFLCTIHFFPTSDNTNQITQPTSTSTCGDTRMRENQQSRARVCEGGAWLQCFFPIIQNPLPQFFLSPLWLALPTGKGTGSMGAIDDGDALVPAIASSKIVAPPSPSAVQANPAPGPSMPPVVASYDKCTKIEPPTRFACLNLSSFFPYDACMLYHRDSFVFFSFFP
jgi:hypothetical protein